MRPWRLKRSPMGLGSLFLKRLDDHEQHWRDQPWTLPVNVQVEGAFGSISSIAVAEGVVHKDACVALERLIAPQRIARLAKRRRERCEVLDDQGRMRLARRAEVRLDAQVDLEGAAFEPAAAALGEDGRLLHFRDAEHALVEGAGLGLATGRHRQLHVIDRFHRHGRSPQRRGRRTTQGQHTTPDTLRLTPAPCVALVN